MTQIEALENQLAECEKAVELRDKALKLYKNKDFKSVILEEFCVNDCARYAQLSTDPSIKPDQRADSLALAQAAGHLKRWLSVTCQIGNQAENQIPAIRDAIDEARREEI